MMRQISGHGESAKFAEVMRSCDMSHVISWIWSLYRVDRNKIELTENWQDPLVVRRMIRIDNAHKR